jgi:hypothetical protein
MQLQNIPNVLFKHDLFQSIRQKKMNIRFAKIDCSTRFGVALILYLYSPQFHWGLFRLKSSGLTRQGKI